MDAKNPTMPLKLDRSVPFVDAIFRVNEGTGTEAEAARILRDAETLCEVELLTLNTHSPLKEIPVELYGELVESRIHGLLSATHLVLGSYEYSQLSVLINGDSTYEWTHREWGHMIAKWANETKWLGVENWNYLDFYGGPNDLLIENYNAWAETAMKVIATK